VIARGKLASIRLARDTAEDGTARRVVVKRVRSNLSNAPEWDELLSDEALLLSSIDHPNVVTCYDAGREDGTFVVLEYVEGDSLEGLLRRSDVWRWPRLVVPIIADALRGLAAAHAARTPDGLPLDIVHQAPSARHILVGVDGRARLADFTQARVQRLPSGGRRSERLNGSFVAPEVVEDPQRVDLRADLFVLGGTLWESLTGEKLSGSIYGTGYRPLERVRRPSTVGLKPNKEFDEVCLRALSASPLQRFASAKEMLDALLDAAEQAGGVASASEIAHWVRSTDALGQAIAKDAPRPAPKTGATTLIGATYAQLGIDPRAPAPASQPESRARKETISWPAPPLELEKAAPIDLPPRDMRATLQGFAFSSTKPSPAPTSAAPASVVERSVERKSEPAPVRDVEAPPRETPAEAESIPAPAPDESFASSAPPPARTASLQLAGWAATIALLACVLLVGDLAMARVLPWPELVLETDTRRAASIELPPLAPEVRAEPSAPLSAATGAPATPQANVDSPEPRAQVQPQAPVPAAKPRPRVATPTAASPTSAQEPLPDNPY
jgi:serine/threonine-protein kinase